MPRFDDIPRLRALDVQGRRVWLRADLDAERTSQGVVVDDAPLRELLPTLRSLIGQRAKVILASSFPSDDAAVPSAAQGVASRLGELLGAKVGVFGKNFPSELRFVQEGQVALTPNLALSSEEGACDAEWARTIAASVDVYVLEGLLASQKSTATTVDLPRHLVARGVGPLLEGALAVHYDVAEAAASPFALLLGGNRLSRVLPLANALLPSLSDLLLGGEVGATFLVAAGWRPGRSGYEPTAVSEATSLLRSAQARNVRVHWPTDVVVRRSPGAGALPTYEVRRIDDVASDEAVVDVGVETCTAYRDVLARAVTALWVGPTGDGAVEETQGGSLRLGRAVAEASRAIVAGRDTVAVVRALGLDGRLRVAPGGDACLELLAGSTFPGIESLRP